MTDKQIKKYCNGLCAACDELGTYNEEPCIYKIANELEEKLLCKEQECEELKIYIESNEQQVKEVETLVMDNDRLINELDQLKQTLTEIEEIAKNMNNECFYDDFDCKDCDMKNGCTYQGKIKILQKIKEAIK